MKWHNAKAEERARSEPELRAALRRERYWRDPEAARERARKWREDHPELQALYEARTRKKNAPGRVILAKRWREENREHLRDRSYWRYHKIKKDAPWRHILRMRERDARKRKLEFALTPEWAQERWTGKCELTGLPFVLTNSIVGFYSPSIDRIDASKGYLPDNCRFILFSVNSFKGTASDNDLLTASLAIVRSLGDRDVELTPLQAKCPET